MTILLESVQPLSMVIRASRPRPWILNWPTFFKDFLVDMLLLSVGAPYLSFSSVRLMSCLIYLGIWQIHIDSPQCVYDSAVNILGLMNNA